MELTSLHGRFVVIDDADQIMPVNYAAKEIVVAILVGDQLVLNVADGASMLTFLHDLSDDSLETYPTIEAATAEAARLHARLQAEHDAT